MIPRAGALRVCLVANVVTGLAALHLAVVAGDGARNGPARTDDLPYGDLLRLDRTGAVIWFGVALIGVGAAVFAHRAALAASAGLWVVVSGVAAAVVVTEGQRWGMSRPSDLALSVGLALSAVVARLDTETGPEKGSV